MQFQFIDYAAAFNAMLRALCAIVVAAGLIGLPPCAGATATTHRADAAPAVQIVGYANPPASEFAKTILSSADIDHADGFAEHDDLTANGSARFIDKVGRLTDGVGSQAGTFFSNERVSIAEFTTTFTFRIRPGTNPMADGITFIIQNNSPTALGPAGGGLGYGPDRLGLGRGIRNSAAVKFDLFNNSGEGINSTGVFTDGRSPSVPEAGSGDFLVNLDGTGVDLHSQHPFRVDMVYDGTTLAVRITDTVTMAFAIQTYDMDIVSKVGSDMAYVGFGGATGSLTAFQDILTWTFISSSGK